MATIEPPKENVATPNPPLDQNNQMSWLTGLVYGVVVIVALGFITLLFSYYQQSAVSYEGLHDQVLLQNAKMDELSHEVEVINTNIMRIEGSINK